MHWCVELGPGVRDCIHKCRVVTSQTTEVVSLHVVTNSCISTMGLSGPFALVTKEVVDSPETFRGLDLKVLTNQVQCRRMSMGETGTSLSLTSRN